MVMFNAVYAVQSIQTVLIWPGHTLPCEETYISDKDSVTTWIRDETWTIFHSILCIFRDWATTLSSEGIKE